MIRAAIVVLVAIVFALSASAQQQQPAGEVFITQRIGGDALTIARLLGELEALRAKVAKLEAEAKKQDDK